MACHNKAVWNLNVVVEIPGLRTYTKCDLTLIWLNSILMKVTLGLALAILFHCIHRLASSYSWKRGFFLVLIVCVVAPFVDV